ncbi:MAG TPA: hypothetical protein GX008_10970 [Firmicutes bacterium]|nr:hypothetical protein [Bacillota bacterium]
MPVRTFGSGSLSRWGLDILFSLLRAALSRKARSSAVNVGFVMGAPRLEERMAVVGLSHGGDKNEPVITLMLKYEHDR